MRQGWCIGLRLLVQLRANNHVGLTIKRSESIASFFNTLFNPLLVSCALSVTTLDDEQQR